MSLKLQVGKRYRRRDGGISGPLELNKLATNLLYPYWDPKHCASYTEDGINLIGHTNNSLDLIKAIKVKPKAKRVSPSPSSVKRALEEVEDELAEAMSRFPSFNTSHEGYAVLLEEVDELWAEIKRKQGAEGRPEAIRKEAVQVAAMALRLILDTTDPSKPAYNK